MIHGSGLTLHESDVMLLDEPTSALDPEMVGGSGADERACKERKDYGCSYHEMGFVREVATRVLFIDDGKIRNRMRRRSFEIRRIRD